MRGADIQYHDKSYIGGLFWPKVDLGDGTGCWNWRGYTNKFGYGRVTMAGIRRLAHRWAYWLMVGNVPVGMELDHTCRNRQCVNLLHLEPVTSLENVMRSPVAPAAINARKTHCDRGHEFDRENTYFYNNGRNRTCRACRDMTRSVWDSRRAERVH